MVKGGVAKALPLAKIGELAFIVVVIVAIVAGLATTKLDAVQLSWIRIALMILGVVVSLTTITEAEVGQFMMVSVALLVASTAAMFVLATITVAATAVTMVGGVVLNIMAFVAPAAIIPSLKAVYKLARTR
jgi:hypothetical protein